jgi:hypothetical protein
MVKLLIRPAPPTGPGPATTSGQVAPRHQGQSLRGSHPRSPTTAHHHQAALTILTVTPPQQGERSCAITALTPGGEETRLSTRPETDSLGQTGRMSEHGAAHEPHSAEDWDEFYSGEQIWSGNPNGALLAEVAELSPGRALDVGCGEGADSVWLARQGWQVTALDISAKAVERTEALAPEAGVQVEGVAAGLLDAALADAAYELVSAMYPCCARRPPRPSSGS